MGNWKRKRMFVLRGLIFFRVWMVEMKVLHFAATVRIANEMRI